MIPKGPDGAISVLGGSRVQIGGPTGAFVVIIYGIVQTYGREALTVCTIMAGVILIMMGLLRMGNLIKWIPYPVTTGFTSGIAVIIFSSQMKDLFGLRMGAVPVMDATGLQALRDFQARCRRRGTALLLCGLQPQPMRVLKTAECLGEFDAWTLKDDMGAALKAIANSTVMTKRS